MSFDYTLDFNSVDLKQHPELYRIGKGEQEFFLCIPTRVRYCLTGGSKHLKLLTAQPTRFTRCKAKEDFVGMDMARKFLQMGYTRSRRYANHKLGRKYAEGSKEILPCEEDPVNAESAKIFYEKWQMAREDKKYLELKKKHQELYER